MKKVTFLLFFLVFFSAAHTQKVYFIYLQSENEQPFYARMGEKNFNSNPAGYLILPNLRDSTYSLNIGIQGSQSQEQLYSVTVNKKDQGFLVKNFGDKGWGLFNLQSFTVLMPATSVAMVVVKTEKRETNAFTELLAKAADDSSLKEKPVIEKPESKKVEEVAREKKDEVKKELKDTATLKRNDSKVTDEKIVKKDLSTTEIKDSIKSEEIKKAEPVIEQKENEKIQDSVIKQPKVADKIVNAPAQNFEKIIGDINKEAYQKSTVSRRSESSTTEGFGMTFLDTYADGNTDTIRILIPLSKPKPAVTETKKEEKKFLDFISTDSVQVKIGMEKNEKLDSAQDKKVDTLGKVNPKTRNCIQVASSDDFLKLRKNMAAETTEENMISEAKKIFGDKCFTTEQLKNLSVLFLTDEGKYKFFDAAYTYVSDKDNFSSLQSELKDIYYINRFKAMLY